MDEKQSNRFVWISLRVMFWVMIIGWITGTILEFMGFPVWVNITNSIISTIYIIAGIFVFVVSIVHLTKYPQKGFAVTALVISSILVLLMVLGLIMGFIGGYNYGEELAYVEEQLYTYCDGMCASVENTAFIKIEPTQDEENFLCYCLNENDEVLSIEQI